MSALLQKLARIPRRIFGRLFLGPDVVLQRPISTPKEWFLRHFAPGRAAACHEAELQRKVRRCRKNYAKQFWRIRRKVRAGGTVKVLFLANDPAKWKCASVYRRLAEDPRFDVAVGLVPSDFRIGRTIGENAREYRRFREWFEGHGCKCIELYEPRRDRLADIRKHAPDIVFYTSSWYDLPKHQPQVVSETALTFYVPYFVANYVELNLDCRLDMHRLYWRHVVVNEGLARLYAGATADRKMAGRFVPLGHPMLDLIADAADAGSGRGEKPCVIYAPHWTVDWPGRKSSMHLSTFLETGQYMLDYAASHPEFEWVFKPHPRLFPILSEWGCMTREAVEAYYARWREIGTVCTDGDYAGLFAKSDLMVTDCGSFLSEYGATGKPVIHLISKRNAVVPPTAIAQAYDTYYKAHGVEELGAFLKTVLEDGQDPKREERHAALRKAQFIQTDAGENIADCLRWIVGMHGARRTGTAVPPSGA